MQVSVSKPHLVPHWELLWRAWSTRCLALSIFLSGLVEFLPPRLLDGLDKHFPLFILTITTIGGISRYVKQFDLPAKPEQPQSEGNQVMSNTTLPAVTTAQTISQKFGAAMLTTAKSLAADLPSPMNTVVTDLIAAVETPTPATILAAVIAAAEAYDEIEKNAVSKAVESGVVVKPVVSGVES